MPWFFLYTKVLDKPLGDIGTVVRSKKPRKLPVVLTHDEAMRVIDHLNEPVRLIALLLYGSGLRVTEACRLRIKDLDFNQQVITIRDGKGAKDRTTLMPAPLIKSLQDRVEAISQAWKQRSEEFVHPVSLPYALARKYPKAGRSLEWQWLFSSPSLSTDNLGNVTHHHRHISSVQKAVRHAVESAGIDKRAGCHTFRHTFGDRITETGQRHPHGAGFVGPCGSAYNSDLHTRSRPGVRRRSKSIGLNGYKKAPRRRGQTRDSDFRFGPKLVADHPGPHGGEHFLPVSGIEQHRLSGFW